MFGLGIGEILIILVFALIFIGPKKLPEMARNLGKGLREFQKAKDDIMDDFRHGDHHSSPHLTNSSEEKPISDEELIKATSRPEDEVIESSASVVEKKDSKKESV